MLLFSRIIAGRLRPLSSKTSVDPGELDRFRQLSSSWWNETGDYAALHSLNQVRVPFIREQLLQSSSTTSNAIKPLTGLQLLDVGCGGGILTEVRPMLGINPRSSLRNVFVAFGSTRSIGVRHRCRVRKHLHGEVSYRSFSERDSPIRAWFVLLRSFSPVNGHMPLVSAVTLEELCERFEHREKYDAVIASEVLEHISNVDTFIGNIGKLLKVRTSAVRWTHRWFVRLAQRSLFHHHPEPNHGLVPLRHLHRRVSPSNRSHGHSHLEQIHSSSRFDQLAREK